MGPVEFLARLMLYISFEGCAMKRAAVVSSLFIGVLPLSPCDLSGAGVQHLIHLCCRFLSWVKLLQESRKQLLCFLRSLQVPSKGSYTLQSLIHICYDYSSSCASRQHELCLLKNFIEIQLVYNIVLVSSVEQSDSVIYIHIYIYIHVCVYIYVYNYIYVCICYI